MAIYYVRTDGNDGNAGTGYAAASAWATLAKAIATVAAGDTVRVAPGTYREIMTLVTNGGSSSIITWWGDKEAQYFLDVNPGYVRITGCDANEIAQRVGNIITSRNYNYFYNFVIDGIKSNLNSSSYIGFQGNNTAQCLVTNCIIQVSNVAASSCTIKGSLLIGGYFATNSCICYNCIGISPNQAFYNSTTYNCIGNSGQNTFTYGTHYNSMAICGNIGFLSSAATRIYTYNCKAMFCTAAYASYTGDVHYKFKVVYCYRGGYGPTAATPANVFDVRTSECALYARGAGFDIGLPVESVHEGYTDISKLLQIANAFKLNIAETGWSTDLHKYVITGATTTLYTPTVSGATLVNLAANDYYLEAGAYNGQKYYVNSANSYVLFYSTTLQASRWVLTAGTVANESATNYCHSATLAGTYTNVTWTGTTIAVANIRSANQDYEVAGTYNGQSLYRSAYKDFLLFYSATLQANRWVLQANFTLAPNETATDYCHLNTILGTYSNAGAWSGTTVNSAFTQIAFTENYDILQHPRRMINGVLDGGAYEHSSDSLSFTEFKTFAPSIQIDRAGYKRISLPVKAGVARTVSCWVKFNIGGSANTPQMIISAAEDVLSTNPITVTATGDGSSYEQLTSTFTPKASGIVFVQFYNRESGAGSVANFSDIS